MISPYAPWININCARTKTFSQFIEHTGSFSLSEYGILAFPDRVNVLDELEDIFYFFCMGIGAEIEGTISNYFPRQKESRILVFDGEF